MRKVDHDPSTPDERRGVEADIQFEDEGGEITGVIPVTERFLDRWTGHVSISQTPSDSCVSKENERQKFPFNVVRLRLSLILL